MSSDDNRRLVEPLTGREQEVLALLVQGKTNRQVAETLVLSLNTVKWYNRQVYGKLGAANREEAAERARELGLVPPEQEQAPSPYPLPVASTPLIGRETELSELRRKLQDGARLVSLTGPGGIGKTRLALEAAYRLAAAFADGAAFVELAALQGPEGLVPAIAQALQFTFVADPSRDEKAQLLDYLRGKALLLVLDNFEHLLDGAGLLADIVRAAPGVKLLVTTRERLRLQAEQVYPLAGLVYTPRQTPAQAAAEPAMRLFLHHARRLRPSFALGELDLPAFEQLFRLVGGMPLALILAATWVGMMEPAQIVAEVGRNLDFLETEYRDLPERQRSMRAVFDSTWARLSQREQELFAALSVFRGGFTLQAAVEVAGATPRELRRLLERSLLARGEGGRFEVHELLRQFVAEQLANSPTREEAVCDRHSAYYLAFLRDREPELKGAGAEAALRALAADSDNVFAAWDRAVDRQALADLGEAAFVLATFCMRSGRYEQGLAAFRAAVESLRSRVDLAKPAGEADLQALVRLLTWEFRLLFDTGDSAGAEKHGLAALSLLEREELRESDMRHDRGLAQLQLGRVYEWLDRFAEATELLESSISLLGAVGDRFHMADALHLTGGVAWRRGAHKLGGQRFKEAQRLYQALGDRRNAAYMQFWVATAQSDAWPTQDVELLMKQSLDVFKETNDEGAVALAQWGLGVLAQSLGEFDEARAWLGESVAGFDSRGMVAWMAGSILYSACAILHQGAYEEARRVVEDTPPMDVPILDALSHLFLGCIRLAQGNIVQARDSLGQTVTVLHEIAQRVELGQALATLSMTSVEMGQLERARQELLEALVVVNDIEVFASGMHVIPAAALLMAATGEPEWAIELYALAKREPFVANSRWFEDVVGRHISDAADSLPPDAVAGAKARGQASDLWQTSRKLLAELQAELPGAASPGEP
jgi:predicted ATPase/DNA-binding CsgD family transcriptional regulator